MNEHAPPAAAIPVAEPDWDALTDVDLDEPIPYTLAPLGEVHGALVTAELLIAVGRVEAAHSIARATTPALSLGDFLADVHRAAGS